MPTSNVSARPAETASRFARFRTFLPFLCSSLASSAVDLGAFTLLCALLRGRLSAAVYITAATIAARVLSSLMNYLINYFFVFQSHAAHHRSAVLYGVITVLKTLASAFLVTLATSWIPGLPELAAKIPADILLFVVNYLLQNFLVY